MKLPRRDEQGISYLSYSQIQLFKRDKNEYLERYIKDIPFDGNAYTDFGSKVGGALEKGCYSEFTEEEAKVLSECTRLDEFEKQVKLKYDDFYVVGYIDTNSKDFKHIIDYKTGGKGKHKQYQEDDYTQLCYYALALRQEYGVTPDKAQVNFISRKGNAFRGEPLSVGSEQFLIDIDISYNRLKKVYWDTLRIAKEIEDFYISNLPF